MSDRADDADEVAPEVTAADDPGAADAVERDQAISPHQDDSGPDRPDAGESPEPATGGPGALAAPSEPEPEPEEEPVTLAAVDPEADMLDWGPDSEDPAASMPSGATRPPGVAAAVEPPSPDVALADEASPLPGAHRGGFQRLPTAPVAVTQETAPAEPGTADAEEPVLQWLMPESPAPHRGLAGWALAFSIAGLVVSIFVGWGFPIGLVGVVSAILALRRPLESRAVAVWALVLGIISVLYSAGWLLYAASRANMLG